MTIPKKFRAYDDNTKTMFTMPTFQASSFNFDVDAYYKPTIACIDFNKNEVGCTKGTLQYYYNLEKCKDYFHLMQFTGIHDLEGKEIYEGDILEFIRQIYIVKFSNALGGFSIEKIKDTLTELLYRVPRNSLKILGNIYENPELLKNEE